jgi:RNA polymerase sigma-70 factor (ECF subfamily)
MAGESSEEELIVKATRGDDRAASRLMFRYHDQLASLIAPRIPAHLRRVIDTDDILQETFVKAWRAIGSFDPEASGTFFAWLAQIAKNTLVDFIRAYERAKRDRRRIETNALGSAVALIDIVARDDRSPSRWVAAAEADAALSQALGRLKEKYREVIEMRYLSGLSIERIAADFGISEGAVFMRLNRAIQKLREEFSVSPA